MSLNFAGKAVSLKLLNRYEVLSELGRGKDSTVYAVRDLLSERLLAAKTCAAGSSMQKIERFRREFQILQLTSHPNIIAPIDFHHIGSEDPTLLTMELFYGTPLLARSPELTLEKLLFIFSLAATALGHIHRRGIIHGDLKPAHLLVDLRTKRADVRIVDFGSAFHTEFRMERTVEGTAPYTAPEVCAGQRPDEKSDLYALGMLFYRALLCSNSLPAKASHQRRYANSVPTEQDIDIISHGSDKRLGPILHGLLEGMPKVRTSTAGEVVRSLHRILGEAAPEPHATHLTLATRWPQTGRGDVLSAGKQILESLLHPHSPTSDETRHPLIILGPAGVGKSRVLREMRGMSQCMGVQWAQATCRPSSAPLQPLRYALKILLTTVQILSVHNKQCEEILQKYRAMLDRILLVENENNETLATWAEERTTWIPDQLSRFLLRLSEHFPFVLALDDFHHADASTIQCIRAIQDDDPGRFQLIFSGREPLETMKRQERFFDKSQSITLAPLTTDLLETLVSSIIPEGEDQRFLAEELDRLAGGNPEHTEITLRRLANTGAFRGQHNEFTLNRQIIKRFAPADEVRASVRALVESLEPDSRTILETISIFSRPVRVEWIAKLDPDLIKEDNLIESLLELTRSGLLEMTGIPPGGIVQFTHALLPETLYQTLSLSRRRKLHAKAAELLITPEPPASAELAAAIATHLQKAEDSAKAAKFAVIAGHLAARTFSMREAEGYYRLAVENLHPSCSVDRLEALEGLGESLIAGGRLDEAAEVLSNLKREATELQKPEYLARALAWLAQVQLDLSKYAEAEELSERALRIAREVGDLRTEARALRAVSDTYHFQSKLEDARASYSRLVALWENMNDDLGSASAWHNLGWVSNSMRNFAEARRCFKKAEQLYRRTGILPRLANTLAAQSANDIDSGYFLASVALLREAVQLAKESRGRRTAALCHVNMGQALFRLGKLESAKSELDMSRHLFEMLGSQRYLAPVDMTLGWVLKDQGLFGSAEKSLASAREAYLSFENQPGLASCLASQSDIYRQLGDLPTARFWSERAVEMAKASEDDQAYATCLMSAGLASCGEDSNRDTHNALQAARKIAREIGAHDTEHLVNLAICEVALAQRQPETVLRSAPGLLKRAESEQLLADRPTIYFYLSQARLMTGDIEAAIQALYDALETAETSCTFDTNLRIHELHLAFALQQHDVGDPKKIEESYRALIRHTRTSIADHDRAESFARFSRERCRVLGELIESHSAEKTSPTNSPPVQAIQDQPPKLEVSTPDAIPMARPETPPSSDISAEGHEDSRNALPAGVRGLFNLLLDRAIHSTESERGCLFLLPSTDDPDGEFKPVAIRNLVRESLKDASAFSRSVLRASLQSQGAVTLSAGVEEGKIRGRDPWTERARNTPSILAMPIAMPESHRETDHAGQEAARNPVSGEAIRCHGVLYLERRISSKPYTAAQERLAWHFSRQAARILTATSGSDDDTLQTQTLDRIAHDLDRESIETALPASDASPTTSFGSITLVGAGPGMAGVFDAIQKFASGSVPVLIQGETGTGKELVAGALHEHSSRAAAPFVAVDCGALSDNLAESELFGHTRGAFSGAHRDRQGLLRSAQNGTLFLDEIGNLPGPVQLKLLRALESKEVRPLGSDRTYPLAFRLVAATNSDLSSCVTRREFRADLYHRLRGGFIQIPPLRDRPEDLEPLVAYLLNHLTAATDRSVPKLSPHSWHLLRRHDWPGNVRELKLALEVALQVNTTDILEEHDFHQSGMDGSDPRPHSSRASCQGATLPAADLPLEVAGIEVPPKLEGRMLLGSMVEHGWDKAAAARAIGWSRQRLYRQLKAHGIPLRVSDAQMQELQSRVDELGLPSTGNGARPHSGR